MKCYLKSSLIKKSFILCFVYLILFLIIFFSKELSIGIKNGIAVSLDLVIPSMFTFMIFSNIVMNSNIKNIISRPFTFISKYLFKIRNDHFSIFILSLIGGYPVGAKLIGNAVQQNNMTKETAEKMLCYCINCSPAFLISAVGVSIFSNIKIGLMLYAAQVITCIIIGIICGLTSPKTKSQNINNSNVKSKSKSLSVLVVCSVNDSVKALCIVCGFIVAFSSIMPLLSLLLENTNQSISLIFQGLLEVTTGCNNLKGFNLADPIILSALFTSFGSICVYLQMLAMLNGTGIKLKRFFIYRIIYVIINLSVVKLFLNLFPEALSCVGLSNSNVTKIYSVSPMATFFLILMSIILLFFCNKSDKLKI